MAPRIERIWGSLFQNNIVGRRDTPQRGPNQEEKHKQSGADDGAQGEGTTGEQNKNALGTSESSESKADRPDVERAIVELRNANPFMVSGMSIEMVEVSDGIRVRIKTPGGKVVKEMTAQEFLALKTNSDSEQQVRGNILDQKF